MGGKQAKGVDENVKIHEQCANGLERNRDHLRDRIQAEQGQEQKAHIDNDAQNRDEHSRHNGHEPVSYTHLDVYKRQI